ncbi:MAG: hypothetical protein AB7S26_19080 [Sandaracinaceae bacterium]
MHPGPTTPIGYCRKQCSADEECPSVLCVSPGECTTGCASDAECPRGFECTELESYGGEMVSGCDLIFIP